MTHSIYSKTSVFNSRTDLKDNFLAASMELSHNI